MRSARSALVTEASILNVSPATDSDSQQDVVKDATRRSDHRSLLPPVEQILENHTPSEREDRSREDYNEEKKSPKVTGKINEGDLKEQETTQPETKSP